MIKRCSWIIGAAAVLLLQGCVTLQEPAFDQDTAQIDTTEKSVFMLDVAFQNDYKEKYQAESFNLKLVQMLSGGQTNDLFFPVALVSIDPESGHRVGLFNGAIEPGEYRIDEINGVSRSLLIIGNFSIPVGQTVTIPENEVVYLGEIKAINRKREDGEFRSGLVIPLLDQAIAGFSGGTMDIDITNPLQDREGELKGEYPALRDKTIVPIILAPFDRSLFDPATK